MNALAPTTARRIQTIRYQNKGEWKTAVVTRHARLRFRERMGYLLDRRGLDGHEANAFREGRLDELLDEEAERARKTGPQGKRQRQRNRAHGGTGTLFLNTERFTLVITDATLVTVELRGAYRGLNRAA